MVDDRPPRKCPCCDRQMHHYPEEYKYCEDCLRNGQAFQHAKVITSSGPNNLDHSFTMP